MNTLVVGRSSIPVPLSCDMSSTDLHCVFSPFTELTARVQPHTAAAFQLTESGRLWDRGLSCGIMPLGTSGGCDSWGPCMKSLMVLPPGVT